MLRGGFLTLGMVCVAGSYACSSDETGGTADPDASARGGEDGGQGGGHAGSAGAGGARLGAGGEREAGVPGGGSDGGVRDGGGPRVMVRIAHDLQPDFLKLDACFGAPGAEGEIAWVGPEWRDDFAHAATFNRVTAYRSIPPGAELVRFVAQGASDCRAPITGLTDQELEEPLDVAGQADTWFTVIALGGIAGQGTTPFSVKTFVDREATENTPFALRVVPLDPALGPVEVGSIPNPDYTGYDRQIGNVPYGVPSEYTSWEPALDTPLYFGFKVFLEGQTAGEPLIVGDRAQSDPTGRGSWSLFIVPARNGSGEHEWSFCADGAEGPRLCYPCGRPGCEGT
jgi:hypothetical protein